MASFSGAAPNQGKVSAVYPDFSILVIDVGAEAGVLEKDVMKLRSRSGETYLATVTEVWPSGAILDFDPKNSSRIVGVGDPVVERPQRPAYHLPVPPLPKEKTLEAINREYMLGFYQLPSGEMVIEGLPNDYDKP